MVITAKTVLNLRSSYTIALRSRTEALDMLGDALIAVKMDIILGHVVERSPMSTFGKL